MLEKIRKLFKPAQVNADLARKYKEVFQGPVGQEVLEDILKTCSLTELTYVPGHDSASAFNEGRRSVALRILRFTEADLSNQIIIEEQND